MEGKVDIRKILPILFIISTFFMGIGYAAISDVVLNINGTASAIGQEGIFIESIDYVADIDAANDDNKMAVEYGTLLDNKIVLSNSNKDSSITYQITIYNNTDEKYAFYDALYSDDDLFYDNQDIVFSLNGINKWDELESKKSITFTITFEYKNGIENITNNELNSLINFQFSKFYSITYKNITNYNYPTRVFEGEDINITFVNDIPDYVEISGTELFNYENPKLIIANVTNDITIIGNVLFKLNTYTFNGTSDYVNTGVALFSDENVNKNFEISFEISAYGNNQDFDTIINSMDESGNGWPGFLIRLQNNNNALRLYYDANGSGGSGHKQFYDYAGINKVQIIRIDNVVYYRFNDGAYVETIDYSTLSRTFDLPVTFGASLDANGNPFRYFQGTLTNMSIKFLENNYQLEEDMEKMYKFEDNYQFNGTTDYINTEMYLFSEENRAKNFEISFEITQNNQNGFYNTLLSIMNESSAPYEGIALRYWGDVLQLSANVNDNMTYEYTFSYNNVQRIRLVKVNGVLYAIINSDEPVYIVDFSSFSSDLNVPVTFGASLDANGNPWRYFNGTLSNMSVRFIQSNITIDDYVELYD